MLMCSLGWDYGLHVDLANRNPFDISCMDWSTEGYQLLMLREQKIYATTENKTPNRSTETIQQAQQKQVLTHTYSSSSDKSEPSPEPYRIKSTLVQLDFVKSSLAVNPCMVSEYFVCLSFFLSHMQKYTFIYRCAFFIPEFTFTFIFARR